VIEATQQFLGNPNIRKFLTPKLTPSEFRLLSVANGYSAESPFGTSVEDI
jgi:hypothetical protein